MTGADFGYDLRRYTSYSNGSTYAAYVQKVNPECNGWGYGFSNSGITAFFPALFTSYKGTFQSAFSTAHQVAQWYTDYSGKTAIIPVFNGDDKGLVLLIETGIANPDYLGKFHDQYWTVWQSCHLNPAVDDGSAVPSGITADRFREILALADLSTIKNEMLYTNTYEAGTFDSSGDTNYPRPWASSIYNAEVGGYWGCGKDDPMDHLEFAWYNGWNRCRVLDYGWSIIE